MSPTRKAIAKHMVLDRSLAKVLKALLQLWKGLTDQLNSVALAQSCQLLFESIFQLLLGRSIFSDLLLVLSELLLVSEVVPYVSRLILWDLAEQPCFIEQS